MIHTVLELKHCEDRQRDDGHGHGDGHICREGDAVFVDPFQQAHCTGVIYEDLQQGCVRGCGGLEGHGAPHVRWCRVGVEGHWGW